MLSVCDISHEKDLDKLNVARSRNPNRILITHLNINSLRNNIEILKEAITNNKLTMIEKWRESLDQDGAYGALLTDL